MSEIIKIKSQFQDGQWPKFLERVEIDGLRGWGGESIHFRFPVVAIAGENGAGKSTVLKVAATAYDPQDAYYPSAFFLNTHWDKMEKIRLGYQIKQGSQTLNFDITKLSKKWSFPNKRHKREVFWFDVARTLPLDATAGYAKVARLAAGEASTEDISDEFREKLSFILGRPYSKARFASPDINEKRPVGLLMRDFGEVSQFHQGAGEDTTLDLIRALQNIPKNSLIIIDEVEASLHPRAQRRLIRVLLELARCLKLQIILSTHSPYVLEELPPEARILLIPTKTGPNVIYGASPEFSLTKLDEIIHPEAFVYVEDNLAEVMVREIIANHPDGSDVLAKIKISPVGAANVVKIMGKLILDNKLAQRGLAVLDGDQDAADGCVILPGADSPERVVFLGLEKKQWGNLHERFGCGAGDLHTYLNDVILNPDFHKWPSLVGDRIIKASSIVWDTMVTEWCRICLSPEDRDIFVSSVKDQLAST